MPCQWCNKIMDKIGVDKIGVSCVWLGVCNLLNWPCWLPWGQMIYFVYMVMGPVINKLENLVLALEFRWFLLLFCIWCVIIRTKCVWGGYMYWNLSSASRFCLDSKGKAKAHIIKNMIFIVSSELLILLQPNLVWWYIIISFHVVWKDWIAELCIKSQ